MHKIALIPLSKGALINSSPLMQTLPLFRNKNGVYLFAGESMFYRRSDASKAALVGLVDLMNDGGSRLIDVQWLTDHLRAMGCSEVEREEYLKKVSELALVEGPSWGSC